MSQFAKILQDWTSDAAEPHLDDRVLSALRGETSNLPNAAFERHLEACAACQKRYVDILPDDPAGNSLEPIIHGERRTPPLLHLVGRSEEQLEEIATIAGLPLQVVEGGMKRLRADLQHSLAEVLVEAEAIARRATVGRYDWWKERAISEAPGADSRSRSRVSHHPKRRALGSQFWPWKKRGPKANARHQEKTELPTSPQNSGVGVIMRAAASRETVISSYPTRPPREGDPSYEFCVEVEDIANSEMQVRCMVEPGAPVLPWGFRLKFEPLDELRALEQLGFAPEHLGVLRVSSGEHRWRSLLDVLIPHRFGSAVDELYAAPTRSRCVPGRPPGEIVGYSFWLFERE